MAKVADTYFKEDPWQIIEEGFDPAYGQVAESVFSLANEYMGVRGYMEEGYSGPRLRGSYFNGIYEQKKQEASSYRGIADTTEFMVNSADWLNTVVEIRGEELNLGKSRFRDFRRSLDMRTGLLTRSFVWQMERGGEVEVTFERILSMQHVEHAVQRITLRSVDFKGKARVYLGIDGSVQHESLKQSFWEGKNQWNRGHILAMEFETVQTRQKLTSCIQVEESKGLTPWIQKNTRKSYMRLEPELQPGEIWQAERRVCNLVCRSQEEEKRYQERCSSVRLELAGISFDQVLEENRTWWSRIWEDCDIKIVGDAANQQGIRFCIFQLFQTYHGAVKGSNIGAKGLTGEAYNGNAFWDTETYCLPFFIFHNLTEARNLLYFRYRTLEEARKRARELDCEGAFYPIATISGKECCNLWQHASLQLQASTAVAYGIWFYEKMSHDTEFLVTYGLEMLIEISRMLASRGDYSNDGSRFGFYGVMGPDEFQMMVNHNCYTNYMGRFTLNYTLECLERLSREEPEGYRVVAEKTGYQQAEGDAWRQISQAMYIPKNEEKKLYEQHEGYFDLPHVDIHQIPVSDFPLYSHWTYDRIYRNDMIKQPDVLMMMLLFNSRFSQEELRANYEFYEPRCIHESSLSPSVHSILASQLGRQEEAYEFFRFATRMDLDNYNRNSGEGIHTTSIAAAWMNIVYGFGGLRSDGDVLKLAPVIPEKWEEYSFRIRFGGAVISVRTGREEVLIETDADQEMEIEIYGQRRQIGGNVRSLRVAAAW